MLSNIVNLFSQDRRELVEHGTKAFPIGCYHDDLIKESVPWHWHEELEAAVVTEGDARITIGNDSFLASEGEGFFVNTGVLHACRAEGSSSCRFHSLVFSPRLAGGSLDSAIYQKYVLPVLKSEPLKGLWLRRDGEWQEEALSLVERAWQSNVREEGAYEIEVRSSLSRFLALLSSHLPEGGDDVWKEKDEKRIKVMLKFISEEFAEDIRTSDIAASAYVSESECLRCFRSTIGKTPIQYLREYRLEQAAAMLLSSGLSVGDAALSAGFQDVSYFIKCFKKAKGCTPGEFQSRSRKQPSLPEPSSK